MLAALAATSVMLLGLATAPDAAHAAVPPAPPTILRNAVAGDGQATVSWTESWDGGSPITGYLVTPYVGYGARPSTTFPSTVTTQVVTGLTNGTQYRFRVQAITALGTSGFSRVTNPVTPAVPAPPDAPVMIRNARAGDGWAMVSWNAPFDRGSPITAYVVTPYVGYSPRPSTTFPPNRTTGVVTGLANGTQYRFRVRAINALGTSGFSRVTNPVTPAPCVEHADVTDSGDTGAPGQLRQVLDGVCDEGTVSLPGGTITLADPAPLSIGAGRSVTVAPMPTEPSGPVTIAPTGPRGVFRVDAGSGLNLRSVTLDGTGSQRGPSGAIDNEGALVLHDVLIRRFTADRGGGIHNDGPGASVVLNGTTTIDQDRYIVEEHPTRLGGGIYNREGSVTLNDLSTIVRNGGWDYHGGGVYNDAGSLTLNDDASITLNGTGPGHGGGVYNRRGSVTLHDASRISFNEGYLYSSSEGGGIYNLDGTVELYGTSAVHGNISGAGGGISSTGSVTLHDSSSVSHNQGQWGAGGIISTGSVDLHDDASVSDNASAYSQPGGIDNRGTLTLHDAATISRNHAAFEGSGGGGVWNTGSVVLHGTSSIRENTAWWRGGGIYNLGTVTLHESATITANSLLWHEEWPPGDALGGGIYDEGSLVVDGAASIFANDPDDVYPP